MYTTCNTHATRIRVYRHGKQELFQNGRVFSNKLVEIKSFCTQTFRKGRHKFDGMGLLKAENFFDEAS